MALPLSPGTLSPLPAGFLNPKFFPKKERGGNHKSHFHGRAAVGTLCCSGIFLNLKYQDGKSDILAELPNSLGILGIQRGHWGIIHGARQILGLLWDLVGANTWLLP